MAYNLDPGTKIDLPVFAWLIMNDNRVIVVDTGGITPDGIHHMPYVREAGQTLQVQLKKHGVELDDVRDVILTHLHWDHASNNELFRNARFYVQQAELDYARQPLPIHIKSYKPEIIRRTSYEILETDTKLFDGIDLILTPGHSPGSQSVIVSTASGPYAIIGDLINLMECWERNPKIANGIHTDLVATYKSFDRLESITNHVLPGHEPAFLSVPFFPQ